MKKILFSFLHNGIHFVQGDEVPEVFTNNYGWGESGKAFPNEILLSTMYGK